MKKQTVDDLKVFGIAFGLVLLVLFVCYLFVPAIY
jgi:hypothetical protein